MEPAPVSVKNNSTVRVDTAGTSGGAGRPLKFWVGLSGVGTDLLRRSDSEKREKDEGCGGEHGEPKFFERSVGSTDAASRRECSGFIQAENGKYLAMRRPSESKWW